MPSVMLRGRSTTRGLRRAYCKTPSDSGGGARARRRALHFANPCQEAGNDAPGPPGAQGRSHDPSRGQGGGRGRGVVKHFVDGVTRGS